MKGTGDDIERYHKGTLSAAERHALEKKALSDPFLADALEGSGQVTGDEFSQDLGRLDARINKRQTLFTPLRIAAGVLIFIAAGWTVLYVTDQPEQEKLTSAEVKPNPTAGAKDSAALQADTAGDSTTPPRDQLLSLKQDEEKPEEPRNKRIRSSATSGPSLATAEEPTTSPTEIRVEAEEATEEIAEESAARTEDIAIADDRPVATDSIVAPVEQPTVASQGLAQTDDKEEKSREGARKAQAKRADYVLSTESAKMKKTERSSPTAIVSGQVTLADDGLALPGVNVVVKGSTVGTTTDLNGNYTIAGVDPDAVLVFSFIGMQTHEATQGTAPKLDVKLTEDVSQLSEVVVTGKAFPADLSGEPVIKLAEPVGGLKAYDKYLEGNLHYPQTALDNNIKGRVSVEFTVAIDGSLSEFKVLKSLGYGCDEEVIRLVKDGPAWIPSTENNRPTESLVRVRMKFDPAKKK